MNTARKLEPVADTLRGYIRAGLVLVPIPAGSKAPHGKGWNLPAHCWAKPEQVPDTYNGNVGLAHAYSGTCALDIDDMTLAGPALAAVGIDLAALLGAADAVHIRSGRQGRDKLLYRLPDSVTLASVNRSGSEGFELRCAATNGNTVQDVLPPSIHPDTGKPYQWAGNWRAIPKAPADLLTAWRNMLGTSPAPVAAIAPQRERRHLPGQIRVGERNDALFRSARGFVQKGIDAAGVNHRIQRINAERCEVPLCATEVDTIAAQASKYPAKGYAAIPRSLAYSPVWKALPDAARTVAIMAYCRDDGSDDCTFVLTQADFAGFCGFGSNNTLRKAIAALVDSGILVLVSEARNTQTGRIPARYAIARKWKFRQVQNVHLAQSAKSAPLYRKQYGVACDLALPAGDLDSEKAA